MRIKHLLEFSSVYVGPVNSGLEKSNILVFFVLISSQQEKTIFNCWIKNILVQGPISQRVRTYPNLGLVLGGKQNVWLVLS